MNETTKANATCRCGSVQIHRSDCDARPERHTPPAAAADTTIEITLRLDSRTERKTVKVCWFGATSDGRGYVEVLANVRYRTGKKVHAAWVHAFLNAAGEYEVNGYTLESRDGRNGGRRHVYVIGFYNRESITSKW